MPIQPADLDAALTGSKTLRDKAIELVAFLVAIDKLMNDGWITTQVLSGVTVTQTIDESTQLLLIARYASLKTELVTIYGTLP